MQPFMYTRLFLQPACKEPCEPRLKRCLGEALLVMLGSVPSGCGLSRAWLSVAMLLGQVKAPSRVGMQSSRISHPVCTDTNAYTRSKLAGAWALGHGMLDWSQKPRAPMPSAPALCISLNHWFLTFLDFCRKCQLLVFSGFFGCRKTVKQFFSGKELGPQKVRMVLTLGIPLQNPWVCLVTHACTPPSASVA